MTVCNGRFTIESGYDTHMRIPEELLNCVAFVGIVEHRDEVRAYGDLIGTGFFVFRPYDSPELPGLGSAYFVTAKHLSKDLKGEQAYFLVNRKGGGITAFEELNDNKWWSHPTDKSADVMVGQIRQKPNPLIAPVQTKNFGVPEKLDSLSIGIGDEVFCVGLFTPASGSDKRNTPIVRHGNIAMIPGEQIQTSSGYADVYLVEARSIGGLSGSPVFVRPTIRISGWEVEGEKMLTYGMGAGHILLGLMKGHWDINEDDLNKVFVEHDGESGVNMGIAMVVPAYKILETIMQPGLTQIHLQAEESALKRMIPKDDSAHSKKPIITKNKFMADLKKVSRKVSNK